MRSGVTIVIAALALAVVPAATPASDFVPSIVTLDGVGEVTPGQSVAQVERRFAVDLRPETISPGCSQAPFRSGPVRGHALFLRGRLGSLWFDRGVIAGRGIAIGASFAALKRAYRALEIRRDAYVPARPERLRPAHSRAALAPPLRRLAAGPRHQDRLWRPLGLPHRGLRLSGQLRRM